MDRDTRGFSIDRDTRGFSIDRDTRGFNIDRDTQSFNIDSDTQGFNIDMDTQSFSINKNEMNRDLGHRSLCTYRLNWARRTPSGLWNEWDDTALQRQDSKLEPWRSEAEHATSRPRRLRTILSFTRGWGANIFVSFKPPGPGTEPRTLEWKAAVLTTTLGPPPLV